jgi:leucyl aminopeptidase (aminopeptidase T)
VNTTPIEGKAKGTIILDGSVPMKGLGVLANPIKLDIQDGRIVKMHGGKEAEILDGYLGAAGDPNDYMITEVGLGLNPNLRTLDGTLLNDEGNYGCVHFGIGENLTLGGELKSTLHLDVMVRDATLVLDDTVVVDKGRMVLPDWAEKVDGERSTA